MNLRGWGTVLLRMTLWNVAVLALILGDLGGVVRYKALRAGLWRLGWEQGSDSGGDSGDLIVGCGPDLFVLYAVVDMDIEVSELCHILPWNLQMGILEPLADSIRRFTNDLDFPDHGRFHHFVVEEVFPFDARNVFGNSVGGFLDVK
jgi:hypothetical protein